MIWAIFAILCFILCCLPIVLPKNSTIRYYSCYVCYASIIMIGSMFAIPLTILMPRKIPRILEKIAEFTSKIVGIEWEIRNRSVLDRHKNTVIVMNHQSIFDFLGSWMTFKPVTKYIPVMKQEIKYFFPFGQVMMLFNTAFIDRKKNTHLSMAILKDKFHDQDSSLLIYPEGTRNHNGAPFLPFKTGAFRIAVEFKRPIIPVVISPYYFIKQGKFTGGKVIVSLLEPIDTTDVNEQDIKGLIDRIKVLMEKEYVKLKTEITANLKDNITR